MKHLQKILGIFKKQEKIMEFNGVSDFFLRASPEQKIKVFREAAEKANQDQRAVMVRYERAQQKTA